MIYLLLNIVLSSYFVLCVKWLQSRNDNIVTVGVLNYITAAVVGAYLFFRGDTATLTWYAGLTGAINGTCYFVAFFFLISAITWKGAANVSVILRLSILLPIVYGVLVWGESPDALQAAGIAVACLSLVLIGRRKSNLAATSAPANAILILTFLFLIAGSSRLSQEMFKYLCQP